jgi:hypothetical protein
LLEWHGGVRLAGSLRKGELIRLDAATSTERRRIGVTGQLQCPQKQRKDVRKRQDRRVRKVPVQHGVAA